MPCNALYSVVTGLVPSTWYVRKRSIALKACSDWILKLQISFTDSPLSNACGICGNIVIVAGIDELKSYFCSLLPHWFSMY